MKFRLALCIFAQVATLVGGWSSLHILIQEAWSPQGQIPIYEATTEEPPLLVADHHGVIHAFNSQAVDLRDNSSPEALFYRQWTPERGWSDPVDVIYRANGNVELMSLLYDPTGFVHLLVQIDNHDVYYSQVPLANAGQALAWSKPVLIAQESVAQGPELPFNAAVVRDNNGRLVVIFTGFSYGSGIYVVYSGDNGISWSDPAPIFLTYDEDLVAGMPKLMVDQAGQIHALWSVFNSEGIGTAAYYSRLESEQSEWSYPTEIDEGNLGLGIKFANMAEHENTLILTYYCGNQNALWWRQSVDDGRTWSAPVRISPIHLGTNGPVSFAVDSRNILHLFFGQRIDDNNHGLWHTVWTGTGWAPAEAVVRGPQVKDEVGGDGFDPRSARAVIANGNLALVTWGTDGAAGTNGAWYSYMFLDAPALPMVELGNSVEDTAVAVTAVAPLPENEQLPAAGDIPPLPQGIDAENLESNPGGYIIWGIIPSVFFLFLFVIARRMVRYGR